MYLIGLGAVGSLINHYLSPKVILKNNVRIPSLIFTSLRGSKSPLKIQLDSGKDEIDTLIVTTKAHQTLHALKPLIPRLSQNSTIYLFQNGGLAIREELIESGLFSCQINMVSISHGIARNDDTITHTGMGSIFIKDGGVLPTMLSKGIKDF
jgi:ketopantoate reductase